MAGGPQKFRFVVDEADSGKRLDQVLAANVPGLSRRKAKVLLDIGGVYVDRERTKKAGRLVRAGQQVEAVLGGALARSEGAGAGARAKEAAKLPEYRVVFEDEHLVVVEKPAGLLTAPTPESDRNNLADLLARRTREPRDPKAKGPARSKATIPIFVVHRIDLDTSGLLVFAKTEDANRALSELFRTHDIEREYIAVVEGRFPDTPSVDEPIDSVRSASGLARSGASLVCDSLIDGRRAVTHFSLEKRLALASVVRARLETGRTHQIRIHARQLGHPVLGDSLHGRTPPEALASPPRMALHATKLGFVHPETGKAMLFESPLPADLAEWLATLA